MDSAKIREICDYFVRECVENEKAGNNLQAAVYWADVAVQRKYGTTMRDLFVK